jgi:hypothetical protein
MDASCEAGYDDAVSGMLRKRADPLGEAGRPRDPIAEVGNDVDAAFPDDLAIGEGSFDRRGGGDDLVWPALDRAACGPLQRVWTFGVGRSASEQRRGGEREKIKSQAGFL